MKFTFGGSAKEYFQGIETSSARFAPVYPKVIFIGDHTMEIAQRSRFATSGQQTRNRDVTILLGYSILAIVFLTALYFASTSSGTAPADFATMTVFP